VPKAFSALDAVWQLLKQAPTLMQVGISRTAAAACMHVSLSSMYVVIGSNPSLHDVYHCPISNLVILAGSTMLDPIVCQQLQHCCFATLSSDCSLQAALNNYGVVASCFGATAPLHLASPDTHSSCC
jgi:hypothetical protein